MTRRFLECSSGHLSPETWAWLDTAFAEGALRDPGNSTAAALAGGPTRYGWFIYATEDPPHDMPADLRTVCALARRHPAEFILLDCHALPDQDLPVLHPDFFNPG